MVSQTQSFGSPIKLIFPFMIGELMLFTDGSVHAQTKIGYGAYLIAGESQLSIEALRAGIKVKRFEETSSTKLELQTLLWALSDIQTEKCKVILYTDSQNIMSLLSRRSRLEQNDYRSKNNKFLNNYELYQEFFRVIDQLDCDFVKVRGHKRSPQKDKIDEIFTLVDRASRNALRGDK